VQFCHSRKEETSIGSETGEVHLTNSNESTCDTGVDGMDTEKGLSMQECFRRIQRLEAEGKKATQREKLLLQQLYNARAHVIEKEKEVCDLQGQLELELTKRQGLFYEIIKRDKKILCLQESLAGPKARTSDVDEKDFLSKTAAESRSGLNVEGATNLHSNSVTKACSLILPLPNQPKTLSPRITPRSSWTSPRITPRGSRIAEKQSTLISPRITPRGSRIVDKQSNSTKFSRKSPMAPSPTQVTLGTDCSLHVPEMPAVPECVQSRTEAKAGDAVADVNQVMQILQVRRAASRPLMQAPCMPASFPA